MSSAARDGRRPVGRDVVRRLRGHDVALYAAGLTFYGGIAVLPTALLAVSAIVVHFLGQSNPELNATGGLRNILWFATFVVAFLTYFTARGGRRR